MKLSNLVATFAFVVVSSLGLGCAGGMQTEIGPDPAAKPMPAPTMPVTCTAALKIDKEYLNGDAKLGGPMGLIEYTFTACEDVEIRMANTIFISPDAASYNDMSLFCTAGLDCMKLGNGYFTNAKLVNSKTGATYMGPVEPSQATSNSYEADMRDSFTLKKGESVKLLFVVSTKSSASSTIGKRYTAEIAGVDAIGVDGNTIVDYSSIPRNGEVVTIEK